MKTLSKFIIALAFMGASTSASLAACYKTTLVKAESLSCANNSSSSADFSSSCQYQPAQYKQVAVACPSPFDPNNNHGDSHGNGNEGDGYSG